MRIIMDTCVWSLALHKKTESTNPYVGELSALIEEARIQMIGPIRQEILSGISSRRQFQFLRERLSAFPDLPLQRQVYEKAADFYNLHRAKDVQGSNTDFLICAVSATFEMPIFTFAKDFTLFQRHLPVKLHHPRAQPGS